MRKKTEPVATPVATVEPPPEPSVDIIRERMVVYEAMLRDRIVTLAEHMRESADRIERHAKTGVRKWDAFEAVEEVINDLTWGMANYHIGQLVVDLSRMQTWRAMLIAATNGVEGVK